MKKQHNQEQGKTSETSMTVFANFSEPYLLRALVDHLADRRYDIGYSLEQVQTGTNAIDTSSIEVYTSGELDIVSSSEIVSLPFNANFLFTCIKVKGGDYNMTWASSLS